MGKVPEECARWCRAQDYQRMVEDDVAPVDLDWWNDRLAGRRIPVRLWGFDADGARVHDGKAFLRRRDICQDVPSGPTANLHILYLAAAWLSGHPRRAVARRFIDVRDAGNSGSPLKVIGYALQQCRQPLWKAGDGPYRDRSGWPRAPGVGVRLLSLYSWAVHDGAPERPQLVDQPALSTLCHLGWLETPVAHGYSLNRYLRYNELLHRWAAEAEMAAELVEMWLTKQWWDRVYEERGYLQTNIGF